jgi:SHS2 domain-containing protein
VAGYEILEHTADVGVEASGATLEECFEQASRGLFNIMGIWRPGAGEPIRIDLTADDVGALLVDWLSELLYLHDSRDAVVAGLEVEAVEPERALGTVSLRPRGAAPAEGTQVKAVTYHQLEVTKALDGWTARVYLDV